MGKNWLLAPYLVCLELLIAHALDVAGSYGFPGCNPAVPASIRVFSIPDGVLFIGANATAGTPNSGFLVDLLNALEPQVGIPFILTAHPELNFGNQNPDGSWTGSLLGALIENQADLAAADLTISAVRDEVVDFLVPLKPYSLQVLFNTAAGINSATQYVMQDDADLTYLQNSANVTLRGIYNNVQAGRPGSIVTSDAEGLAKTLSGNFAYVCDSPVADLAITQTGGLLNRLPDSLGDFFLAFAVQENSTIRQRLNLAFLKISEAGTLRALAAKYGIPLTS